LTLTYLATDELYNEGLYRVINNSQQKPDWHNSRDHTGNTDGKMLVINGSGYAFYSHAVNSSVGFAAGDYSTSLFIMNVNWGQSLRKQFFAAKHHFYCGIPGIW